jgi:hypothetical protein
MKTMKLVMIAALLTFGAVNMSNAEGAKSTPALTAKPNVNKVIKISFEKAIQIPGLVAAMNHQLNLDMVVTPLGVPWTGSVIFQNDRYLITGSREQWEIFFNWQRSSKKSEVISR